MNATSSTSQIRLLLQQWNAANCSILAAAIAYYTALAFFPLLLVAIAVLGVLLRVWPYARDSQRELLDFVAREGSQQLADQIEWILIGIRAGAGFSGAVGVGVLLINLLGICYTLQCAIDEIWGIKPAAANGTVSAIRQFIAERFKAFCLLMALGLFLFVVFSAGMTLTVLRNYGDWIPGRHWILPAGQLGISFGLNTLVLTAMYKVLPRTTVHVRDAVVGGLASATVWEVGRQLLALLVIGNKYTAYGLVGSFIALMLWVYYAAMVVLMGAVIVQVQGAGKVHAGNQDPEELGL